MSKSAKQSESRLTKSDKPSAAEGSGPNQSRREKTPSQPKRGAPSQNKKERKKDPKRSPPPKADPASPLAASDPRKQTKSRSREPSRDPAGSASEKTEAERSGRGLKAKYHALERQLEKTTKRLNEVLEKQTKEAAGAPEPAAAEPQPSAPVIPEKMFSLAEKFSIPVACDAFAAIAPRMVVDSEAAGRTGGYGYTHAAQAAIIRDVIFKMPGFENRDPVVCDWEPNERRSELVARLAGSGDLATKVWKAAPISYDQSNYVRMRRMAFEEQTHFDAITCFDVYKGFSAQEAVTVSFFKVLLRHSSRVFWIGRAFEGSVGGDSPVAGRVSAVWHRVDDQIIYSGSEDSVNVKLFDANWIFQHRTIDGLSIVPVTCIGPYTVFCATLHTDNLTRPREGSLMVPSPFEEWLHDPLHNSHVTVRRTRDLFLAPMEQLGATSWLKSWWKNIYSTYVPRSFTIHTRIWSRLAIKYETKMPYGYNLDAALTQVEQVLLEDPLCSTLASRFPHIYNAIRQGTALAVLYRSRSVTVENLSVLRKQFQPQELDLLEARIAKTETNIQSSISLTPVLKVTATAILTGIGLWVGYKLLRAPPPRAMLQARGDVLGSFHGFRQATVNFWNKLGHYFGALPHPIASDVYPFNRHPIMHGAFAGLFAGCAFSLIRRGHFFSASVYGAIAALNVSVAVAEVPPPITDMVPIMLLSHVAWEEAVGSVIPQPFGFVLKVALGVFEYWRYVYVLGVPPAVRIPALLMHLSNAGLAANGKHLSTLAIHVAWNTLAILLSFRGQWMVEEYDVWADGVAHDLVGPFAFVNDFISEPGRVRVLFFKDPAIYAKPCTRLYHALAGFSSAIVLGLVAASCGLAAFLAYGHFPSAMFSCTIPATDRFAHFVSSHAVGDRPYPLSHAQLIPAGMTLRPISSQLRYLPADHSVRGDIALTMDDIRVTVHEAILALSAEDADDPSTPNYAKNVMYPLCITNGLLWEPAKTDYNLLVALVLRIHNDPFKECPPAEERHAKWQCLVADLISLGLLGPPSPLEELSIELACAAMGKNGARILRAWYDHNVIPKDVFRKTVFLKWNETITASKSLPDGSFGLKPRVITNLEPSLHALMSPLARALSDRLHSLWNEDQVYLVGSSLVTIVYASGYNQERLSRLWTAMEHSRVDAYVVISGDDSVFRWRDQLHEGDLTAQDQSEDEGPLIHFLGTFLRYVSAPEAFIQVTARSVVADYRYYGKRLKIKGHAGVQQPTGTTLTTVVNSLVCGAAFLSFVYGQEFDTCPNDLSREFASLGFTLKDKVIDPSDATFLKGWWRRDLDGNAVWLPLVSAAVKIGKILVDPAKLFKGAYDPYALAANAVSSSYGHVPEDYPILGPLLALMRRGQGSAPNPTLVESYNVRNAKVEKTFSLDRQEAVDAVARRYRLNVADIDRVERLIRSCPAYFPVFLEDPVFVILAQVDYE